MWNIFFLLFIFPYSSGIAQNTSSSCIPTINVKVIVGPAKTDSTSPCFAMRGLMASDRSYSIISFKIRGENLCNENGTELVAQNTGAAWNEAHLVINSACAGSILKFTCVKAQDKNGKIHILQPLTVQLNLK